MEKMLGDLIEALEKYYPITRWGSESFERRRRFVWGIYEGEVIVVDCPGGADETAWGDLVPILERLSALLDLAQTLDIEDAKHGDFFALRKWPKGLRYEFAESFSSFIRRRKRTEELDLEDNHEVE